MDRPLIALLVLTLIFGALYFLRLGQASLWEIDEAIYAEIGREMQESGDLTGTYFNYAPRFDKPPLTYWLMMLSYRIFGIGEFAVRFFSALLGLAGLLLLYAMTREMLGARIALVSSVILGSCLEYPALAIQGLTDMPLTFFTILTFFGLWRAYEREQSWCYLLAGLGAAFATLTKGPVGLLLPGGVLVLLVLADLASRRRPWPKVLRLEALLALGLALLLTAPWYLAMYHRFGRAFLADNFGYHMFARFTKPLESHGQPWFYYLILLFVALIPWSPGLLGGLPGAVRQGSRTRLLLFWGGFYLLFYSAARTKLPGYLLPALPPAAVLAALWWNRFLEARTAGKERWALPATLLLLGLVLVLVFLNFRDRVPPEYAALFRGLFLVPYALIAIGLTLVVVLSLTRRSVVVFAGFAVLAVGGWLAVKLAVLPGLEAYKPTKRLAQAIERRRQPRDVVICTNREFLGLPFYLRQKVLFISKQEARSLLGQKRRVFVAAKNEDGRELLKIARDAVVLEELGRGSLISNRPDQPQAREGP